MADPQTPDDSTQSNSSVNIGDSAQVTAQDIFGGSKVIFQNSAVTLPPPAPPPPLPNLIPLRSGSTYIKRGIEDIIIANLLGGMELEAIVSVHAPGGIGKTEMAKVVSARCETYFDAVKWVDCGTKTPEQILADLAREIGHTFTPAANYLQQRQELTLALARAKHLIIFDDVRRGNQMLLQEWMPPRPCAVLITSRVHHVSNKIPANSQFDLERMDDAQARTLLGSVLGTTAVEQERAAADRLVERCLGNPLALEIAARRILELQRARVSQPIERITRKVEARRAELRAGADPRHNLWAVFDSSYDELSADEQARFRKLAACANTGFSVNLAAALWGTEPPQATTQLEQFAALSLVLPIDAPLDAGERFRLHDLLDDYALDKLQKAGEEKTTRDAHAQWLLDLFDTHYTIRPEWRPLIEPELDNLRAAARWAQDSRNGDLLAQIATKPRNWLYNIFRVNSEWLAWLTQSLELGVSSQWMQANVRKAMGDVLQFRKEMNAALESYNQALALFQQVGDRLGEANVRKAMGDVLQFRKEMNAALESYNQALALYQQVGAKLGEANVLAAINLIQLVSHKNIAQADAVLESIRQRRVDMGDRFSVGSDYFNFAVALLTIQEWEQARIYTARAREIFRKLSEPLPLAQCERLDRINELIEKTVLALVSDDRETAQTLLSQAEPLAQQLGEPPLYRFIQDLQAKS